MTDGQEGREGRDHCFPLSQSLTVLLLRHTVPLVILL